MADTKISALTAASALTGAEEFAANQGGASRKVTASQIKTFAAADTFKVLTATQSATVGTPAPITGLTTTLTAGTYLLKVWICYQAAATTTGIEFRPAYTGTHTRFVGTWYTLTTGATATTGIADQSTTSTAQLMEGKGHRASDVNSGPMQGVDTAASDQFAVYEGILVATGGGDVQFKFATEVAGSAVTVMEGTTLTLTQVA